MARPKASQSGSDGHLVAEASKSGYMKKASKTPSPEVLGICNVIVLDSEDESETVTFKLSSSKFGSSRDLAISGFSMRDPKPILSPSRSSESRKMKDSRKRVLAVEDPSGAAMFDSKCYQASPSSTKRSTLGLPWDGNCPHSDTRTTPGPAVDLEATEQFTSAKRKRKSGVQAVLEMQSGTPQRGEQDIKENHGSAVQGGNGLKSDNSGKKRKKEADTRVDPESSSMEGQLPPDLAAGGSLPSEGTTMSTCHQCRQRHDSTLAWCRDTSGKRACTQKYCIKCLRNRYGEVVQEVQERDTWSCPRCRGICNCSMCMKKKGLAPTGGLAKKAKAAGYSSVADLLEKFPNMREERYTREENAPVTSEVEVAMPIKRDPVHQPVDDSDVFQTSEVQKKRNQVKADPGATGSAPPEVDRSAPTEGGKKRRGRKKKTEVEANASHAQGQGSAAELQKDVVGEGSTKKKKRKSRAKNRLGEDSVRGKGAEDSAVKAHKVEAVEEETVLPTGAPLLEVGDLNLPPEAIGPALQILEFCSAFEKPLRLKRAKGLKILAEMLRGGTLRRGGQSDIVHLHAQLLSILLDDVDDDTTVAMSATSKNCWVYHLGRHLTEQFCISGKAAEQGREEEGDDTSLIASTSGTKSLPLSLWPVSSEDVMVVIKALKSGVDGYGNLSITTRLQLLATLCDDTLSTKKMREYLEKVISNHEVEQKENRDELLAVKKQVHANFLSYVLRKELLAGKKQAKKEVAAGKRDNVLPVVSPEHAAGVNGDKAELAEKEAQLTETAAKLCAPRCDALRTEPEAIHKSGSRFWRLKGVKDREVIVLQDISNLKRATPDEAWSVFSEDQQVELLQCITNLNTRKKAPVKTTRRRRKRNTPVQVDCKGPTTIEPESPEIPFIDLT